MTSREHTGEVAFYQLSLQKVSSGSRYGDFGSRNRAAQPCSARSLTPTHLVFPPEAQSRGKLQEANPLLDKGTADNWKDSF